VSPVVPGGQITELDRALLFHIGIIYD